ncbi:MAG: putative spermidine/putrescine transport system permease protein [Solirubrobacterales bacterium]|nr:putative spermidine/putrescine transport system permease protein [Solirubrobacterales bacterium]
MGRRLADLFHGRPRLQAGALLAGPVGWLVVGYLGSLAVLLVTSFWTLGELSGEIEQTFTLDNFRDVVENDVYRSVTGRTVLIAGLVTVTDALLAFPLAFYMAKIAGPRTRGLLLVAVLMPLWSAYLVKIFAWRGILSQEGVLNWALEPLGIEGPGYGLVAVWLVMSYIWLPYMVIPIYAGLERIPNTLLSASEDMGAKPTYTFRRVILPLALPAVIAGSIFTFSLTLGDFIAPTLVGSGEQFIGTVVRDNFTVDLPFAAAFATVPIVIMIVYLLVARRMGAFEHL